MIDRRTWITRTGGAALLVLAGRHETLSALPPKPVIEVYKDPSCGCCEKWVDHLRASRFTAYVHNDTAMEARKDRVGVPASMRSCHTALIGGYIVEGHVPAADIQRMLREKPKAMGLAIPGMPMSAPGMGEPGARVQPYSVLAFERNGSSRIYAQYR
ncbi:MAG: DUF411 domain-containing protein [Gemmatimonadales bacterium]|nr:DUF411 domain-containing protein [Gemmatimonadales bacterium]